MLPHSVLPPEEVPILEGSTAGALLAMLLQGKLDWRLALSIFACGEVVAFFFTLPVSQWLHMDSQWEGPMGLTLGFSAMYLCGALITVLVEFQSDPLSLIKRLKKAIWPGGA